MATSLGAIYPPRTSGAYRTFAHAWLEASSRSVEVLILSYRSLAIVRNVGLIGVHVVSGFTASVVSPWLRLATFRGTTTRGSPLMELRTFTFESDPLRFGHAWILARLRAQEPPHPPAPNALRGALAADDRVARRGAARALLLRPLLSITFETAPAGALGVARGRPAAACPSGRAAAKCKGRCRALHDRPPPRQARRRAPPAKLRRPPATARPSHSHLAQKALPAGRE